MITINQAKAAEIQASVIRNERDKRITVCDYLLMPDYPMSEQQRQEWATYRQALRDLPEQEGFPWDGAIEGAPWPTKPEG